MPQKNSKSNPVKVFILRAVCYVPFLKKLVQKRILKKIITKTGFEKLNIQYKKLGYKEKELVHSLSAKICVNQKLPNFRHDWILNFAKKEFKIKVSNENAWLAWDTCLSIIGHDIEVKDFYHRMLLSKYKPNDFFDVGANYGTHTLLFALHKISTYSFEPNPFCKPFYDELMNENKVKSNFINSGLGDQIHDTELIFPENETWNGSILSEQQDKIKRYDKIKKIKVQVTTLDKFSSSNNVVPDFLKIDTEGFEFKVLEGGEKTIKEHQPIIVFESLIGDNRMDVFDFFERVNYHIFDLSNITFPLTKESFINSNSTNFSGVNNVKIIKDLYC
jgi:FkbM family methyltransferase